MIGDQQPVAVSPGEFIVPADVVSGLGDGDTDAGADELDAMMNRVRVERTGTTDPIEEVTLEVDYASYQAAGEDNRKIIYDFDYEMTKNDDRRSINLIQPTFVAGILDEVRQTFR